MPFRSWKCPFWSPVPKNRVLTLARWAGGCSCASKIGGPHGLWLEFQVSQKCESEVAQSCPTLCDPMDCSPPGSSIHGIFQARGLEWVAISFSRGSSWPRDRTQASRIVIAGRRFTGWATRQVQMSPGLVIKLSHPFPWPSGPGTHIWFLAQVFTEGPHRGWYSVPVTSLVLRGSGPRAWTHSVLVDWNCQHGDIDGNSENVTIAWLGCHMTKLFESQCITALSNAHKSFSWSLRKHTSSPSQ